MARQTSIRAYNNEVQGFKNKLYPKILETLHEIDKDGFIFDNEGEAENNDIIDFWEDTK